MSVLYEKKIWIYRKNVYFIDHKIVFIIKTIFIENKTNINLKHI